MHGCRACVSLDSFWNSIDCATIGEFAAEDLDRAAMVEIGHVSRKFPLSLNVVFVCGTERQEHFEWSFGLWLKFIS